MKSCLIGMLLLLAGGVYGDAEADYRHAVSVFESDPVSACNLFVQAATEGNVSAMVGAGHCFETGTGTTNDYAKAIEWYEKAVAQNSLKACEGLARIYASCPDLEFHDGEKAVKFATPVARKKPRDAEALALLAAAYARNFEFKKALDLAMKASRNASDVETAKKMRARLDCLKAGEPEPAVATEVWFFKAADKNSIWAMVEIAGRYADRDGDLYDAGNAILLYRKAIKAGRTDLLYLLGNVYFYAENDHMDLDKAEECYDEAVEEKYYKKGDKIPCEVRCRSYLSRPVEDCFKGAEKYRMGWTYTTSSETGNYYADGSPVYNNVSVKQPPHPETARFLFLIAHKKGHPQAKKQLALVKDNPITQRVGTKAGVPSEYNQMITQARKYEKGTGVKKDLNKALEFYLKAHEQNKKSSYPPWNIGDLYLRIRTPKRDVEKAIYWLEKAVSLGGEDAGWRLADFYATDKDPAVRDGKKAVKYAKTYADYQMERYEKSTHEKNVRPFGSFATLAHAYARNGQFKEAEKTMLLTIEMMKEGTFYDRYIDSYNKQLALFRNNQAWPPD